MIEENRCSCQEKAVGAAKQSSICAYQKRIWMLAERGQQIDLHYDPAGRLTRVEDADRPTERYLLLQCDTSGPRIDRVTDGTRTVQ